MTVSRTPPGLRRGRKKRAALLPQEVTGRKYLQILRPFLHRLHAAYPHPNRVLFYDDVVISYLVAFFSPALRSLRLIENASQVPGVNKYLNVDSVCSSTLSDANALFDPSHLAGLIADLREQLPKGTGAQSGGGDAELTELLDSAILVDGSFFRLAADVQWALHAANQYGGGKGIVSTEPVKKARKTRSDRKKPPVKPAKQTEPAKPGIGAVRLNCQFCLKSGVPIGVSVNGSDHVHESTAALAMVEPGHLYVFDSGVVSFNYLSGILDAGSHLLCNMAAVIKFNIQEDRKLTQEDLDAGIVSDSVGFLPGSFCNSPPKATLRQIIVQYTDRDGKTRRLRLLTDLLNLSAKSVAELYKKRWQIELFFRWLKVSANFRHLTSHSKNGVSLSFHIAVIAALLMVLRTGRPLSVHAHQLMGMVFAGQASFEDIQPILEYRERERRLERERLARKRAAQKSA